MPESPFTKDVGVIGGGGHVGLPLSMTFARCGLDTAVYDVNSRVIGEINEGRMPFFEEGGEEALAEVLSSGRFSAHDDPGVLSECEFLVMAVGTPLDRHLNPSLNAIHKGIEDLEAHLRPGQVLVLRSTVFPGISEHLSQYLEERGTGVTVAFCPERVAQGKSLAETTKLPQLVSAFDGKTKERVRALFSAINPKLIELSPMEAELAKLMTNAWRYLEFAVVNQFYMIASKSGLDFNRILHACRHDYPRMAGMPGPGFAAGPCLVKDTMQLAAFSHNQFFLGHAAMIVNEGLPLHLVELAKAEHDLRSMTAGILGMAFKADNDDHRDSLSYKLKKILSLEAKKVLCTDPYVDDPDLLPVEKVLAEADILFLATPHTLYKDITPPPGKPVLDVWGFWPAGGTK